MECCKGGQRLAGPKLSPVRPQERRKQIVVLSPVVIPDRVRYRFLHNQIDLMLARALHNRPDVVVAGVQLPPEKLAHEPTVAEAVTGVSDVATGTPG